MPEEVVWRELRETFTLRRKLVESDSRRRRDLHQMISIERALAYGRALTEAVKRHVSDARTLAAIDADFRIIVGGGHEAVGR